MNKNISFFIALSFCNIAFTNDLNNNSSNEEIVVIEEKKSIPSHNLTIKIQSKNNDSTLFNQKSHELLDIIQSVHRSQNSSNLYNQILSFIKETQEAIIAGYNLLTTASTATPFQLFSTVEEVLTEETTPDNNQTEDTSSTKNSETKDQTEENSKDQTEENSDSVLTEETSSTVSQEESSADKEVDSVENTDLITVQPQAIEISVNIFLEKEEDKDLFDVLVAKMNTLALFLNEGSHSAEEITTLFNEVILAAHHLPNTNLTIKIV